MSMPKLPVKLSEIWYLSHKGNTKLSFHWNFIVMYCHIVNFSMILCYLQNYYIICLLPWWHFYVFPIFLKDRILLAKGGETISDRWSETEIFKLECYRLKFYFLSFSKISQNIDLFVGLNLLEAFFPHLLKVYSGFHHFLGNKNQLF